MKKVIKVEKANLSEEEKSKRIVRSLKAIYLAALLAFTSYATIDSINRINAPKQIVTKELEQYDEYAIIEDNLLAEIDMGNGITLKVFKPITKEQIGSPLVEEKYQSENGLCYKLYCEGEAPAGYTKLEDGTLIRNEDCELSPEGYIIVGNKAIDVITPEDSYKNGYKYFTLPKGYILIGDVGVGIIDYQKEEQKTLKLR